MKALQAKRKEAKVENDSAPKPDKTLAIIDQILKNNPASFAPEANTGNAKAYRSAGNRIAGILPRPNSVLLLYLSLRY